MRPLLFRAMVAGLWLGAAACTFEGGRVLAPDAAGLDAASADRLAPPDADLDGSAGDNPSIDGERDAGSPLDAAYSDASELDARALDGAGPDAADDPGPDAAADASALDAPAPDAPPADAQPPDAIPTPDARPLDAMPRDAMPLDASAPDANPRCRTTTTPTSLYEGYCVMPDGGLDTRNICLEEVWPVGGF